MTPPAPDAQPAAARRCLVTGGAGFIGSHLVEHLLSLGRAVTIVDDLSTGRESNLAGVRDRIEFHRGTVSAVLRSGTLRGPFDDIYHLAAAVGVQRIIERPIESIETNVQETAELLRFAVGQGERPGGGGAMPRVLIASSSEVYGKSAKSPFREDDDCVYGPTTASRWSYACTKAIDEYLALAHHARHRLPAVVARFFNTVGPRQVGDYGMVVPRFVRAAMQGRSPQVFGDGQQSRCFCDVRDVVPAIVRLLDHAPAPGNVFNVGSDRPITMMELAELVIRTLGSRVRPVLIPYDEAYAPGFEDLRQRRPDIGRLRSAVGFEPTIGLERTIRDIAAEMSGEANPPAASPARSTGGHA